MKFSQGFQVVIYIKLAKVIFDKKEFCWLAIATLYFKAKQILMLVSADYYYTL